MTVSFLRADEDYPEEICGICRDSLTEDVYEHALHRFHGRCIAEWVKIEPTCPSCKKTVDTTTLLGENILLKQDELNQTRERIFKLKVIEMCCKIGAFGCLIAPFISERHKEYSNELLLTSYCFAGIVLTIKCYFRARMIFNI